MNGSSNTSLLVNLWDISLPEIVNGRTVDRVEARLFDSPTCRYDIILGGDFLQKTNMKFYFSQTIVDWMVASITIEPVTHYNMLADVKDIGLQPEGSIEIQTEALLVTLWISYGHPMRIKCASSSFEFHISITLAVIWISRAIAGSNNWMSSKESLRVSYHSILIALEQK